MRILFCGTIVPESYDTKLRYLSPVGNRFQINFCKELMRQGNSVRFLSYIGFPIEGGLPDFKSEQVFSDGKVDYIYRKKKYSGKRPFIYWFNDKIYEKSRCADKL